ncbi:hypothetical protein CEXT_526531 [Caerostris extrusa]|uniref:Uncharacterized protein n=1 Tax=Caerostris extrusa TaxID=172846 RepID=A0AAV4PY14_CAEEX|nr:hypothetical protein CEXT_526531 [Caerostris extrusa]
MSKEFYVISNENTRPQSENEQSVLSDFQRVHQTTIRAQENYFSAEKSDQDFVVPRKNRIENEAKNSPRPELSDHFTLCKENRKKQQVSAAPSIVLQLNQKELDEGSRYI